jgi:DNA-binding transcriptional regulator LsrR (DeoR family)
MVHDCTIHCAGPGCATMNRTGGSATCNIDMQQLDMQQRNLTGSVTSFLARFFSAQGETVNWISEMSILSTTLASQRIRALISQR